MVHFELATNFFFATIQSVFQMHPLYLYNTYCSLYIFCLRHNGKTPLLCAAEAGHEKIVTYLLQLDEVRTNLKNQPQKVYSASVSYHYITCMYQVSMWDLTHPLP